MIIIDCIWLIEKISWEKILKMVTLLKVKAIKISKYKSDKFVLIFLDFSGINIKKRPVYV